MGQSLYTESQDAGFDDEQDDGGGKGFGGIKMDSVKDVIAKARFNEFYLHANLGLSENLEELASHFQSKENGE